MSSIATEAIVTPRSDGFTDETFEAFLREREEPAWLVERRREAFARFQAFAWPSGATRSGDVPTSAGYGSTPSSLPPALNQTLRPAPLSTMHGKR